MSSSSRGRKDSKTASRGPVVSIDNDEDDGDTRVTTFKLVPERPKTPERKPGFVSTTPSPYSKHGRKRAGTDDLKRSDSKVFKKPKQDLIPNRVSPSKDKKTIPSSASSNGNLYANQYKNNKRDSAELNNKAIQFASPHNRTRILDMMSSPATSKTSTDSTLRGSSTSNGSAGSTLKASSVSSGQGNGREQHKQQQQQQQQQHLFSTQDLNTLPAADDTMLNSDPLTSQIDIETMESLIDLQKLLDKDNNIDRGAEQNLLSDGSGSSTAENQAEEHTTPTKERAPPSQKREAHSTTADGVKNGAPSEGKKSKRAAEDAHRDTNRHTDKDAQPNAQDKALTPAKKDPYALLNKRERIELELRKQRWRMCTFDEWKQDGVEIVQEFERLIMEVRERVTAKVQNLQDFIDRINHGKAMLGDQKRKLQVSRQEINETTKQLILKNKGV